MKLRARIRLLLARRSRDIVSILAAGCLAFGAWQIAAPAGWIVLGLYLLVAAGAGQRSGG